MRWRGESAIQMDRPLLREWPVLGGSLWPWELGCPKAPWALPISSAAACHCEEERGSCSRIGVGVTGLPRTAPVTCLSSLGPPQNQAQWCTVQLLSHIRWALRVVPWASEKAPGFEVQHQGQLHTSRSLPEPWFPSLQNGKRLQPSLESGQPEGL